MKRFYIGTGEINVTYLQKLEHLRGIRPMVYQLGVFS